MAYRQDISYDRLRQVLDYDPATGEVTWRERPAIHGRMKIGRRAGSIDGNGYKNIMIDGIRYQIHRLIFLYMEGVWPSADVDHIDMKRANNSWSNLRRATRTQNQGNVRARKDCTSGYKGAHKHKLTDKWQASIQYNKRRIHLGLFDTVEEAAEAYKQAAIKLFGEFARSS